MRTFNFTGKKKILREDITIRLQNGHQKNLVVDITLDFSDYDFPADDVHVAVEAYYPASATTMRFNLGELKKVVTYHNIALSEFEEIEDVKFRLKVIKEPTGMILGLANGIKVTDASELQNAKQKNILPVRSIDLSDYGVLWRVRIDEQDAVLEVEKELGHREQVVKSLTFKGFILPAAMHQILSKIVSSGWDPELGDPDEMSTKWLIFAKTMGADMPIPDVDNEEWLDETVKLLTNRIGVRKQLLERLEGDTLV
jgi:hypothetical protein